MTPEAIRQYRPSRDLLQQRIVLVTGASEGIGKAAALAYARHGATVVLLAKELNKLEQVYDEIEKTGGPQPAIYPMNLESATTKDYEDLAGTLESEFGRLDGLLNNAGWVGGLTPLQHYDVERWAQVMTINLHAPFLLSKTCLTLLGRSDDPAILFSTDACLRAYWGAYGIAKHAMEGLLTILSDELNGENPIRVNGIDTGPVGTWMRRQNYPGEDQNTLPSPEQVIPAYLYFMGPDSKDFTGRNLHLAERSS
ncbi:MAG: YciK family oxidoreductase [Gammaproteobacteria bacterium]|nr:YciK family oxidoreductase [Gammaproteobacteria bacterium]